VSWNDAEAFCRWLTDKERGEAMLGPRQGYRLPQDWEWSVAVGLNEPRGGTPKDKAEWSIAQNPGVYPWGRQWPPPRGAGNYADAAAEKAFSELTVIERYDDGYATTSPVGSFAANRYGIYDLGGNVWEWCEDRFDSDETSRVVRGASWLTGDPVSLSSAYCGRFEPGVRDGVIGFRCVLELGGVAR
jgi:formylglycine-generating enzyme required for sulfatase activity